MRFGVDEREAAAVESDSGGAEGNRIAASECGEGMVAVWGSPWRPSSKEEAGGGSIK